MKGQARRLLDSLMRTSRAELLPVRIRRGFATGARWTLFPWTSYWRGTHEPGVQAALAAVGGGDIRGWSCWDLGAHYGYYSVGLARRVGARGEVAAFEPNPLSYARLERHRRMNGLAQLKTFQAAVSDAEGTADFLTYGDLGSTSSHLRYDGELGVGGTPVRVATVSLDAWVDAGRIRRPDFIKVDVEGHGHRALAGARGNLAAKRPVLMVAFHSDAEVAGIHAILEPLRYRWREIAAAPGSSADPAIGRDFLFTPRD